MRTKLAGMLLALALLLGGVAGVVSTATTATPAQALDDWHWSGCRPNSVMWADDHNYGFNYWHVSWPWSFNGYKVSQRVYPGSIFEAYRSIGYECSTLGIPISNVYWNGTTYQQNFNCGSITTAWSQQAYAYIAYVNHNPYGSPCAVSPNN